MGSEALGGPPNAARDPAEPISESEQIREREVRRRLAEAAGAVGRLRFDRFMEIALYASGVGFYTEPGAAIGPNGAFYTAAHASELFGRTVARRIVEELERLGRPATFTVAEVGCGDGTLSADILRAVRATLGDSGPMRYLLVDRSPTMRAQAAERVAPVVAGSAIEVRAADSLASDGPFAGVVVANELLDALPFRRWIRRSGGWRELEVRLSEDSADWAEGDAAEAVPGPELPAVGEGAVAEISPACEGFVREIADHLIAGAALLFDYGEEADALLRGHPSGTLAAVRHHRPMPDPLAHPGLLDLSAFVNFTRVRGAARTAGLIERAFRPQAEALVAWGLPGLAETAIGASEGEAESVRIRLSVKNLLFGFTGFKVLELAPTGPAGPGPTP
ncbi:MAG TPA: SAM-dependent methyltransferase [Thermoplasmata archaeon]|nr:SAM-dependent methyltransferase [Thermoplasmata archaeon]